MKPRHQAVLLACMAGVAFAARAVVANSRPNDGTKTLAAATAQARLSLGDLAPTAAQRIAWGNAAQLFGVATPP